jgi:hypothetical protein
MLHRLLRLPTPTFPADLITGNTHIDSHLRALDAALIGAAGVRRETLFDARDVLLTMRDRALDAGADEISAIRNAIAMHGSIETIAQEQRALRASKFFRTGLMAGLVMSTAMLLLILVTHGWDQTPWVVRVGAALAQGVLFGGLMGYCDAYLIGRQPPRQAETNVPGSFDVYYTASSRYTAYLLIAGALAYGVFVVAGALGIGPYQSSPVALYLFSAYLVQRLAFAGLRTLRCRIQVSETALTVDGLFGRQVIPRAAIVNTGRAGILMQLALSGLGLAHYVSWRGNDHRLRRTHLFFPGRDLINRDRLQAWLETAARNHGVEREGLHRV